MPIVETPSFVAVCDGCNRNAGQAATTREGAAEFAGKAGWATYKNTALCPECLAGLLDTHPRSDDCPEECDSGSCLLRKGHEGVHRNAAGTTWSRGTL